MAEKIVVFYDEASGVPGEKIAIKLAMKSLRRQRLASKKKVKLCFSKLDVVKFVLAAKSSLVYVLEVCSNGSRSELNEESFSKRGKVVIQAKLEFDGTGGDFIKRYNEFREGLRK